jgi:hypothetical protein
MKKRLLICLLFPFLSFGQVQIGQDIDGESTGDLSGFRVSLSSNGNSVAIGALKNNGQTGADSGHARVYTNNNGVWTQVGQDIDGEDAFDESGRDVSLSSDGSIVAVGARGNNSPNGQISGHVRVYKNVENTWIQIGQDIDGEGDIDASGGFNSISSDGNIIAISARFNDGQTGVDSGHVRIYENINDTWTHIGEDIDGENMLDQSGIVSLSSDGRFAAIGAPVNDGNGDNSGHARIFENINGSWIQIGQDIDGESAGDLSGIVSLSSDGSIVAIGAEQNDDNGNASGHVRIFENINGNWIQIGEDIDGENAGDLSGINVSLSSDVRIIAIGAPRNDGNGNDSGQVRIYQNQNQNWIQVGEDINGENANDLFGRSVSLSDDGRIVAIGAPNNDGNGNDSGHVRIFDLSDVLSTEEVSEVLFKIYPNPASTNVTIQLDQNSILKKSTIYNSLGQIVKTSIETMIDTSDLSKGIYILEVTTDQGKASKKLIIE